MVGDEAGCPGLQTRMVYLAGQSHRQVCMSQLVPRQPRGSGALTHIHMQLYTIIYLYAQSVRDLTDQDSGAGHGPG